MRPGIAWAALDLMGSLLLVIFILVAPPPDPTRAAIETYGRWAIVVTWPAGNNDVDTWYRAPDGSLVWFADDRSDVAHLEQDDLGASSDVDPNSTNRERVVLRATLPGEHIANVHAYALTDSSVPVHIELWRLQGNDRKVYETDVTLSREGQEETAFRFQLSRDGALRDINDLPMRLVMA